MSSIRQCNSVDFEQIFVLLKQLWPDKTLDRDALRWVYSRGLESGFQRYLCAVENERVVGFCSLTIKNNLWQAGYLAHIDELIVKKSGVDLALAVHCWLQLSVLQGRLDVLGSSLTPHFTARKRTVSTSSKDLKIEGICFQRPYSLRIGCGMPHSDKRGVIGIWESWPYAEKPSSTKNFSVCNQAPADFPILQRQILHPLKSTSTNSSVVGVRPQDGFSLAQLFCLVDVFLDPAFEELGDGGAIFFRHHDVAIAGQSYIFEVHVSGFYARLIQPFCYAV
jgi:hypothetical protein